MCEVGSASARMARPAASRVNPNECRAVLIDVLLGTGCPGAAAAPPPPPGAAAAHVRQKGVAHAPVASSLDKNDSNEEPLARAFSKARSFARWGCRVGERGLGELASMKNRTVQAKNPASAAACIQYIRSLR